MEPDGLAELAGARGAETHYQRCCNTERGDAELTLHACTQAWVYASVTSSGSKLTASGFVLEISRLCRELLRLCNDTRDVLNLQHRVARTQMLRLDDSKPRSLMRICRQGSQSRLAGQHRTT